MRTEIRSFLLARREYLLGSAPSRNVVREGKGILRCIQNFFVAATGRHLGR
jgi:hypothetical protein